MAKDDHDKHFVGEVAQKALIQRDGHILLVKYPAKDFDGEVYDLPGGRIHEGESAIGGLKREVREEISAEINPESIIATGIFSFVNKQLKPRADKPKLFFVIYKCSLVNPEQTFVPEVGEIGEVQWVSTKDFFDLKILHTEYQEALKSFLV